MKLKVKLTTDEKGAIGNKTYSTEVNAKNFNEISLVLNDLKNLDLPIEKAIKHFNLSKSDWDAILGI
jgi:hypothetical protein